MAGGSDKKASRNKTSGRYVRQRIRTTQNKARAWKKHLRDNPNDKQAIRDLAKKDF
jgi:hypothetical protein